MSQTCLTGDSQMQNKELLVCGALFSSTVPFKLFKSHETLSLDYVLRNFNLHEIDQSRDETHRPLEPVLLSKASRERSEDSRGTQWPQPCVFS